jgi:hypothetical protein
MLDRERMLWRKSSLNGHANGNRVEVAVAPDTGYVRDTKDGDGGSHRYSRDAWLGLRTALRSLG